MTMLIGIGLVVLFTRRVWASPAMAIAKHRRGCPVSDYGVVNKQMQKVLEVMPDHKAEIEALRGARALATLDLSQGYKPCPLAEEAQRSFTIATLKGLVMPTRVPQGVLTAMTHFQYTIQR